jgi:predicted CopG family antitoxin
MKGIHSTKHIAISEETYKELSKHGSLQDTFDSTISRLLKSASISTTKSEAEE